MKFQYLLAGTVFFLAALLWTLPPQKALAWWGDDLQAEVRLYAPQGGAGRGSAAAISIDQLRLDETRWRLRLLSLLKLRLGYAVDTAIAGQPGSAIVEFGLGGSLYLHDVKTSVPVGALLPMFSGLSLPVDGQLHTDIDYLRITGNRPRAAEGSLQLARASWPLRPPLPLGGARLDLTTEGDRITGQISDQQDAPVEAKGTVSLDEQGAYQVEIQLKPRANADERLRNLMQGLGRPDAQGWYKVRTQGTL